MKKLFTLFALLAICMGVKAVEVVDAEVDFSKFSDISEVPFYGWRGSDISFERLSLQDGCLFYHADEATENAWDVQFFPIGGVTVEVGMTYTLTIRIKGSVDGPIWNAAFAGVDKYNAFNVTTDWQDIQLEYEATGSSGDVLFQCGSYVGDWWISSMKITHEEAGNQRPVEWIEQLTNGDAETPWGDLAGTLFLDQENNTKICAWGKEKGNHVGDDPNNPDAWCPFPATIEPEEGNESNHVFVVHGKVADTEGDPSAWDNQFWIESPKQLKVGSQFKLSFRYKASEAATTNTQFHHQNPSDYVFYQAIGDINFTTEWQTYEGTVTVPEQATDAFSIAFNLNPQNKNAVDFFFDDMSLSLMKLDEGLFVASSNTVTGVEYDYDNATEFVLDEEFGLLTATVGTVGKQDSWVNEIMISTVRGHRASFLGATIKPLSAVTGEEDWLDYESASNYKIKLPAAGVYQIFVDTEAKQISIIKLEGEKNKEPIVINPNPTVVVVKGQERNWLNADEAGEELPEGYQVGYGWDNQFFIVANRVLDAGEETVVEFDYVATTEAKTTTQSHGAPGAYIHWAAIGDVTFTTEENHFAYDFTIPAECAGKDMKSIAFNMAEIKGACDYTIKNIVWKLKDDTESLINQTGVENFYVKEGAGTDPHVFVDPAGISGIVDNSKATTATFNLAGQRVTKSYKGIVVKNGSKYIVK